MATADFDASHSGESPYHSLVAVAAVNPERARMVQALHGAGAAAGWNLEKLMSSGVLDDVRASLSTVKPARITGVVGQGPRSALLPADRTFALVPVSTVKEMGPNRTDLVNAWSGAYDLCTPTLAGGWRPVARVEVHGTHLVHVDRQGRQTRLVDGGEALGAWSENEVFVPPSADLQVVIDPAQHTYFEGGISRGTTCTVLEGRFDDHRSRPAILKTVKSTLTVEATVNGYLTAAEVLQRNPDAKVAKGLDAGYDKHAPYGAPGARSFYAIDEFIAGGATLESCLQGTATVGGVRLGAPSAQETARLIAMAARSAASLNQIKQPDGTVRPAGPGEHVGHTDLKPDNFIMHLDASGRMEAVIIDKDAFIREGRLTLPAAHQSAMFGDIRLSDAIAESRAGSVYWDLVETNMVAQLGTAILSRWEQFEPRTVLGTNPDPLEIASQGYRRAWADSIRSQLQPAQGSSLDRLLTLASAAVADDVSRRPSLPEFIRRLDAAARATNQGAPVP